MARAPNKVSAILTSYEIVWAIPRRAPNNAYFELEAQPLPRVQYTLILEIAKKAIKEKEIIRLL